LGLLLTKSNEKRKEKNRTKTGKVRWEIIFKKGSMDHS